MTLQDLAERWYVDKLFNHGYIPLYESLFKECFGNPLNVKYVTEIGIGYRELMEPFVPQYIHGASLYLWREYFPNAKITAGDIHPHTLIFDERIWSKQCDQSSRESMELFANTAMRANGECIVIDDGSHVFQDQVLTAEVLLPFVRKGGVYIIEDVYPDTGAKLAEMFGGELYEFGKRPDDCLVVIRR